MSQLRGFQPADLDTLYRIDQVCFPSGIAYSHEEIAYYLHHPKSFSRIAEDSHQGVLGFCIAQEIRRMGRRIFHIVTIDVLPQARRQGIGRALMAAMEAQAQEKHIDRMRLEVAVDNLEAQSFYSSLGFQATGKIRGYYQGKLDAFVMEKQKLAAPAKSVETSIE